MKWHIYHAFLAFIIGYAISSSAIIYSCIVTFFNDSAKPVLILDYHSAMVKSNPPATTPLSLPLIAKGTSRRIGKSTEHAHFTVYTKQPKGNGFTAIYEVQQNECGKNGNPYVTLSNLKNKTGQTNLFTITELSGQHTSMVRQLPSMQRADIYKEEPQGCSACETK